MKKGILAFITSPILWGGGACFGFYTLIRRGMIHDELVVRYTSGHPVEYITVALFFVGMTSLFFKYLRIAVAHGRGVILLACERAGIPVAEYTPLQVKQAVAGYGYAEKKQVMEMVRRLCSLSAVPRPDDAADAVAIAICHARSSASLLSQKGVQDSCSTI